MGLAESALEMAVTIPPSKLLSAHCLLPSGDAQDSHGWLFTYTMRLAAIQLPVRPALGLAPGA